MVTSFQEFGAFLIERFSILFTSKNIFQTSEIEKFISTFKQTTRQIKENGLANNLFYTIYSSGLYKKFPLYTISFTRPLLHDIFAWVAQKFSAAIQMDCQFTLEQDVKSEEFAKK